MDLEDPASNSEASLSTSSSSSTSASSFSSLFAFFDPSSSPALFSSSSSASHSSAASAVKWVDRSGSKNWDSPMWQLGWLSKIWDTTHCHTFALGSFLSNISRHMFLVQNRVCSAQIVGIAHARRLVSVVWVDKDKDCCFMDFFGVGPWTMDQQKPMDLHGPHGDPQVHCAPRTLLSGTCENCRCAKGRCDSSCQSRACHFNSGVVAAAAARGANDDENQMTDDWLDECQRFCLVFVQSSLFFLRVSSCFFFL